ncbi:hypothetical protein [Acanthamoeba polyphaga mimivirus]|nr:hypothetical protein [Acanthamoeba polyphaga mimivirus]
MINNPISNNIFSQNNCLLKTIFTNSKINILSIKDVYGNCWYMLSDISSTFLIRQRKIKKIITKDNLDNFKHLCINLTKNQKKYYQTKYYIKNKTLFVNNKGIFTLIPFSKNLKIVKIWYDIIHYVLPSIYTDGMYTLPLDSNELQELTTESINQTIIKKYFNESAIYLSYIGNYDTNCILTFGKTRDLTKFKIAVYKKRYKYFNIIALWNVIDDTLTESNISKIITDTNPQYNPYQFVFLPNLKPTKNIIVINRIRNLNYHIDLITDIIQKTKLFHENAPNLYH